MNSFLEITKQMVKNLTVDVNIKDAVFKLSDGMYLFGTISNSDSDIKLNFNF